MSKTSEKLAHLERAARGAKDVASQKQNQRGVDAMAKEHHIQNAVAAGADEQAVREVADTIAPYEEPDQLALAVNDKFTDSNLSTDMKMRTNELRNLYVMSTLSPKDFFERYLREGESVHAWTKIMKNQRWDDLRVEYHQQRIDTVVNHFKDEAEDLLEEHNQLHLQLSKQIGMKIMSVLPGITKPVELQSCAVALKNIQSVSRLALGASTENNALKGVDDFEEFLKSATKRNAGVVNEPNDKG